MIKAQFKSYGSYVTDSVYQWDLNQKLSISGLVMSSAPVIAYSSKAVKKAIIVQSKIVDGVINCDIPNALLQFDNDITAHLCSLENKQYKAVEKMIIPVIKRAMPADYLFTDNVPILTYEAIEVDIQHYYNLSKSYTDSAKSEIDIERKRIDNLVKDTTDNVVEYKADNFLMSCKSDAQASTTETALNVFKNISSKSENLGNFITISSNSKIQIKKSGLYSFDCKVQVTGVNASTGRQYARLKINDVQKNKYMISLIGETDEEFTNFIVSLNEGDTISFTGESDFDDTWITLYTTIHILDYDGKVKIPDITKEVSDIRVGEDGTVYGTAGEAVRKQIGNLTEDLSITSDLAELNATGQENKVWYQNGVRKTDGGWKLVKYNVSNINKIYVTGKGKAYRDFVTCFYGETYVKSLTQSSDTNYVNAEYDVSDCDTVYVLQWANTDDFSVKIITQKVDKYSVSDIMRDLEFTSVLHGYFQKTTFTQSEGDRVWIYDVRECRKVSIKGTLGQYQNVYTLLDANNNGLNYDIVLSTGNNNIDVTIDVTNYEYIAINDSVAHGLRVSVKSDVNFRNYIEDKKVTYKSFIPMKWVRTEQYTFQREKRYSALSMVSNVFDVSNLNTVRVVAKSSAYVNYYTLIRNGAVVRYNFNDSADNLVEIDEIIDVSDADELFVTVDHGHEARQGMAYTEEEIYNNNLYGKKIGWWGTSIPAFGSEGYNHPESYPKIVGGILGAEVNNHAVGESCVHCKDFTLISASNPYGFVGDFRNVSRCLTNTIEEMQWIIDNYKSGVFTKNVPTTLSADDKALILGCSYENRLLPYLNTTDLFVFDHGHNDKADTGNHSYDTVKTKYGEKNLYSYVGAMNWIMDLIKTNNPRAEVIQISEYDYNTNRYGVEKQRKFAELWGIPFMELYKLTGWTSSLLIKTTGYWNTDGYWVDKGGSEQSLTVRQMYLKDDLHPYTDRSNKTSWYLAELISNWMKSTL